MLSCQRCTACWVEAVTAAQAAMRNVGNFVWQRTACDNSSLAVPMRIQCLVKPLERWRYCSCCLRCYCCDGRQYTSSGKSTIVAVQPIASEATTIPKLANNNFIVECNTHVYGNEYYTPNYGDKAIEMCDGNCSLCNIEGGNSGDSVLLLSVAENTMPVLSVGIPMQMKPTYTKTDHNNQSSKGSICSTLSAINTTGPSKSKTFDGPQNSMSTISYSSNIMTDQVKAVLVEELQDNVNEDNNNEEADNALVAESPPMENNLTAVSSMTEHVKAVPQTKEDDQADVLQTAGEISSENSGVESTSGSTSSDPPLKPPNASMPMTQTPKSLRRGISACSGGDADVEYEREEQQWQQQQQQPGSPTIGEGKLQAKQKQITKSLESLYERRTIAQTNASLDNAMENGAAGMELPSSGLTMPASASGLPRSSQPQHTLLIQKAKTTHFLRRDKRRVSPVRQAEGGLGSATYTPYERPREAMAKMFDQLGAPQWEVNVVGLKAMICFVRYHGDLLDAQMHMVCIQLARSVRNLRSQVARGACNAATELFALKPTARLEQEGDDLIGALFHRTADTNRFLRDDATHALEAMCTHLTSIKILQLLTTKGAVHQNALVRTTTAKLLHQLAERLGNERVYTMAREHRDKFFVTGANMLLEGSLDTRGYAKSLFRLLSQHQQYNRVVMEAIPARTYRNVEKTLRSIR